jgi:two-component system CheB/CheR fusion protein
MTAVDPPFEALLVYLKEERGFDFTGYKRSSLVRRVRHRMIRVGIDDYTAYLDHLRAHPDEFTSLFNTILINVTGFFRDPDAWDHLRAEVLTPMLAARPPSAPVRAWSAGCASGEEAYTLAIVLAEMLGPEEFRERVKIYATDVDEEQLTEARQGSYGDRELRGVPDDLVARYFEPTGRRRVFRKDLRRSVIFGRNDLVRDAPISRIDLLVCRNTLMYFNAETQSTILGRFHFALGDHGALFLGKAETLLSHGAVFAPIDLKRRIFRRVPRPAPPGAGPPEAVQLLGGATGLDLLRDEAFAAGPVAQLVLTTDGRVALVNRRMETTFGLSERDLGRPFSDLDVAYRPVELRKYIEQARLERRTLDVTNVEHRIVGGDVTHLDVQVGPLSDGAGTLVGLSLTFHDVTVARRLQDDLETTHQQLEAAYEELQSTHEELEATNEELQSTVEELETTNEELQSTNEELETMNEELRSTNDELHSINDQLHLSTGQRDTANSFLETVLGSLRAGVAVLDGELRVRTWNRRADDLWGMRGTEVAGRRFLDLDIGLPLDRIRPLLRAAAGPSATPGDVTVQAVDRRGRTVVVRVACSPLGPDPDAGPGSGVVVVMEPDDVPVGQDEVSPQ